MISRSLRLVAAGATLLLAIALMPAHAQKTYSFPKSKPVLSISIPESWTEKQNDDDYFECAKSGDNGDEIYVGLWMFEKATTLKEAAKQVGEELGAHLKNVKVNDKEDTEPFNGMECVTIDGTGKYKNGGEPCEWEASLFTPDGKSIYALMYYGDPKADKKYAKDLKFIVDSLKKK